MTTNTLSRRSPVCPESTSADDDGRDQFSALDDAIHALLRAMVAAEWDVTGCMTVSIGKYTGSLKYFACESDAEHYHDCWFG